MSDRAAFIAAATHEIERVLAGQALAHFRFAGNGEEIFKRFFEYISAQVPAWRDVCWRGSRVETLRPLPVLERTVVAANPQAFLASHKSSERVVTKTTSGFTGAPLTVAYDLCAQYAMNTYLFANVVELLGEAWKQKSPGSTAIGLVTSKPSRDAESVLLPMLGSTIWRRFPLNDASVLNSLSVHKPAILYGKPMYIRELIDLLSGSDVSLHPSCVLTSGERLYDDDRSAIKKIFNVGVIDAFTTSECGFIAVSDLDGKELHVQSDLVVIEVLGPDGVIANEGSGELLITSVFNWLNPLVRYRTGDYGCVSRIENGAQLIRDIRRMAELTHLNDAGVPTTTAEAVLRPFKIWDFRLRVIAGIGFLIWSSATLEYDLSKTVAILLKKKMSLRGCRARRVCAVTRLGTKRMRYPQ
ncbi:phenylacetate--CoA ligase family protein [Rhizobium ruizarguesonis]|uniref:hypothetical protein n=1 Tax=Rhizobium ruizarguesonis TaxID=2081791 RepID=UPI0010304866|nr:hypothetical protein [Rhizobium ruizarguesonis]TBA92815.1 hypothetical protein ELH54_24715 [Rhizobium ruizarguesonis]